MDERANKDKIFDTILAALKETRSAFIGNFISGFALMLTAFGLLFAYERIKPFLEIDVIYMFSVIILIVFSILYSRFLLEIKRKTSRLIIQLNELDYMDKQYYQDYEITAVEFIPMVSATLVMFAVMILVLSWIKFFS